MKAALKMEKDQEKEWPFIAMEIDFRDNFLMEHQMALEYLIQLMEADIKAALKTIAKREREYSFQVMGNLKNKNGKMEIKFDPNNSNNKNSLFVFQTGKKTQIYGLRIETID